MKSFERLVVAGGAPSVGIETAPTGPQDHFRLADECFLLATIARDPEAAAELIKKGDEYLRLATQGLFSPTPMR
jgi:hypothetical protein